MGADWHTACSTWCKLQLFAHLTGVIQPVVNDSNCCEIVVISPALQINILSWRNNFQVQYVASAILSIQQNVAEMEKHIICRFQVNTPLVLGGGWLSRSRNGSR